VITEKPTHWLSFNELLTAPVQRCLIFEDFDVDFEVAPLTATERAQRRWFGRKHEKAHES
jgi:hypothetical protein